MPPSENLPCAASCTIVAALRRSEYRRQAEAAARAQAVADRIDDTMHSLVIARRAAIRATDPHT